MDKVISDSLPSTGSLSDHTHLILQFQSIQNFPLPAELL